MSCVLGVMSSEGGGGCGLVDKVGPHQASPVILKPLSFLKEVSLFLIRGGSVIDI